MAPVSENKRQVLPECLPDKNIRVQVYRASIVSEMMDFHQKYAGIMVIGTETI